MCVRSRKCGLTGTMVPSIACGVKVTNRPQAEQRFGWPGMPQYRSRLAPNWHHHLGGPSRPWLSHCAEKPLASLSLQ